MYLLYKGSDVRATGIRTGKTYWWYHRRGKFLAGIELDREGGDVYLTWRGPWSPPVERGFEGTEGDVESIDRVDIATGKILWRQDLAGAVARSAAGQYEGPVVGGSRADADTVVLLTRRLVIGLAHGDGRRRWVFRHPKNCTMPLRREKTVAVAGTLVVPQECTEDGKGRIHLAGIDTGTGSPRWRLGPAELRTGGFDSPVWVGKNILKRDMGGRLVLVVGSAGSTRVMDPADGRVVSRAHGFDPTFSELSGDLLVQGDCLDEKGRRRACQDRHRSGRHHRRT
ncbi:PQQ-binding-like beta-propeller repeat protein [Actinomadura sp. HBU206391]|uniref:outer membrane protein assembly factor BamB family protein n=1 Tax=Actinomadura sp. HBU206391 TaxID=2731692 RepID=UPI001650021B|nr:PQQ-binding-like beta-propeller repeat protein [Actinomadura sp. HBU206391]MBC6462343.1 PQQ-binding-like beta-propeller repeat protein [Actinomadura sp. HBU206391]